MPITLLCYVGMCFVKINFQRITTIWKCNFYAQLVFCIVSWHTLLPSVCVTFKNIELDQPRSNLSSIYPTFHLIFQWTSNSMFSLPLSPLLFLYLSSLNQALLSFRTAEYSMALLCCYSYFYSMYSLTSVSSIFFLLIPLSYELVRIDTLLDR